MFCGKVKEFLSQNKIEYTERNIVADETALAELEKLGYMTTPVTAIDGEVVVGFDRARRENLLHRSLRRSNTEMRNPLTRSSLQRATGSYPLRPRSMTA